MSLAVFGVLGAAIAGAVQTSHTSKGQFEVQSEAENIIRNQMEYVYEQAYQLPGQDYLAYTTPEDYSVTAESLAHDTNPDTDISKVLITVYHHGESVKTLETTRVNR